MFDKLQLAKNEKDVENVYRAELLRLAKDGQITSPHKTDGFFEREIDKTTRVKTLLEFKFKKNLKNKLEQAEVLLQCLFYLKRFQMAGEQLPSTIFIGDTNECFVVHVNEIAGYLTEKLDWSVAASESPAKYPVLLTKLHDDPNINPFVYDVDPKFSLKEPLEKITELTKNVVRHILVSRYNVEGVFDYFTRNILDPKNSLTPNQQAHVFIDVLINPDDNYLHPRKPNTLITKLAGEVKINSATFQSLFKHIRSEYTYKEKEELVGNVDMLVEMQTRRFKGEFFTPDLVALKADEYLQEVLGENYKQEYVVWDCAWGTGNLTKHYQYKELYVSTLEQCDIDTANQLGINPESVKFQFDFLNDELEKLPKTLSAAFSLKKPILFFINPPFGTAGVLSTEEGKNKEGISSTKISQQMKKDGWGAASQQLYTQFLYRITKIKELFGLDNVIVGIFAPPIYLSGSQTAVFRSKFLPHWKYNMGFLANAALFSQVKGDWGVSFAIFKSQSSLEASSIPSEFSLNIVSLNGEGLALEEHGAKVIYNLDQQTPASEWVREFTKGAKTFDCPQLSSAINVKQTGCGKMVQDGIGYFDNQANNIYFNSISAGIFSSGYAHAHGVPISRSNYFRIVALSTARRIIQPTWVNQKDEYITPLETHVAYSQWKKDCIVYTLFNTSSQQSSMRSITYKGNNCSIFNAFFWLSQKEMLALAEQHYFDELYQDARFDTDRFVYQLLYGEQRVYDQLSTDARAVLDMASDLVRKSFPMRKLLHQSHPEWHLQAWDAGWYQVKLILKEYYKDDLKEFSTAYKAFEERMRPLVYELGFLRK